MGQEASRSETGRALGRRVFSIRSDKDQEFTGAVANGNTENENLSGLESDKVMIRRVIVISAEQLALTVAFFRKDTFQTTDLDLDTYSGEVQFTAAQAVRMNNATYTAYYYDSGGLEMPYEDEDATGELHVAYVCRDAAGKSAGATGYVTVIVLYECLEEE